MFDHHGTLSFLPRSLIRFVVGIELGEVVLANTISYTMTPTDIDSPHLHRSQTEYIPYSPHFPI